MNFSFCGNFSLSGGDLLRNLTEQHRSHRCRFIDSNIPLLPMCYLLFMFRLLFAIHHLKVGISKTFKSCNNTFVHLSDQDFDKNAWPSPKNHINSRF